MTILGEGYYKGQGIFNLSSEEYKRLSLNKDEKNLIKPFYTTVELMRYYGNPKNDYWVIYTDKNFKNVDHAQNYPTVKRHLDKFEKIITSDNKPYGLHRARNEDFFVGEKIISLRKCIQPTFTLVNFDCYVSQTFNIIKTNRISHKYLVAVLNSRLIKFWLNKKGKMQGSLFQIDKEPLLELPLIKVENVLGYENLVDKILVLYKELRTIVEKFIRALEREFNLQKPSKKLQDWHTLTYANFIKELTKQKITLTLAQKAEWEDYFIAEQTKAQALQTQINQTDQHIDHMVYQLYGLTDDEIAIIEGAG